jgi:hypothetical protein
MTPTPTPRNWDRVDAALAGVIAFADVDELVERATAQLPIDEAEARHLAAEAPGLKREAAARLGQLRALRERAAEGLALAATRHAEARRARRRLRWRVRGRRLARVWRFVRPGWRVLTWPVRALGRLAGRAFLRRRGGR